MSLIQPSTLRESIKKLFNFCVKSETASSENYSDEYLREYRKPYISSRHLLVNDRPVKVHVALTKSKPGESVEHLISKQSLTEIMKNDSKFNSFINNQYQLKSTVIVEGVKQHEGDKPLIYVNDSIPVSLKRRCDGKKQNKEISIRCKLYKILDNYPKKKYIESDRMVSPQTMRKVEVPLTELRSSLNGFTRRLSTFEEVSWLTAQHLPQAKNIKSGEQINLEQPSAPLELNESQGFSFEEKGQAIMPYRAIQPYNTSNKSLSFPIMLKQGIFQEFATINHVTDNFQTFKPKVKSNVETKLAETSADAKVSNIKPHVKITTPIIRQTTSSRNRRDKASSNSKSKFHRVSNAKPEISEQSFQTATNGFESSGKSSLKLNDEKSMKRSNLRDPINNKKYYGVFVNSISAKKDSLVKKSKDIVTSTHGQEEVNKTEEIPVTSIVIKRSKARLIKFDDGTDIEEKVGRQTVRVDAPPGALYAHYAANSFDHNNDQINVQNYDSRLKEQHRCPVKYTEESLKQELKISDEIPNKYSEDLTDIYNPLNWLYSHYNKTKSLLLQFNKTYN